MTDERQRDLDRLLRKASLTPWELGRLEALKRDATPAEQEQADAKLAAGLSAEQVGRAIAKAAGKAAGSLLNDGE
jgi:hypothetical protein